VGRKGILITCLSWRNQKESDQNSNRSKWKRPQKVKQVKQVLAGSITQVVADDQNRSPDLGRRDQVQGLPGLNVIQAGDEDVGVDVKVVLVGEVVHRHDSDEQRFLSW